MTTEQAMKAYQAAWQMHLEHIEAIPQPDPTSFGLPADTSRPAVTARGDLTA